MKLNLTVGIPAYNEEKNIYNLINQILLQDRRNFDLKKIVVISDGSSDLTVKEALRVNNELVELIDHKDRQGKAFRFNELLSTADTDILIQFDADTKLSDNNVLDALVSEIKNGADIVSPKIYPLPPNTLIERLAFQGILIWERLLISLKERSDMHRCLGRARGFSRNFYKHFKLPKEADRVEDTYSFFFAITNNYKFRYVPEALVNFRLPSKSMDYIRQMRRYFNAPNTISKFFDKDIIEKYTPSIKEKLRALIYFLISSPLYTFLYLVLQVFTILLDKLLPKANYKDVYELNITTKDLN